MSENMALWQAVERTDPKHVKGITGKSYQGNSPKPHYLVHKATETFGPCGIGWGFTIADERIEEGADGERMHFAHVKVWYKWKGERGEVEHVGGTQFSGTRSSGKAFTDEDAPKKSVTDALVKALSMIGFAGDIFMGRYDDSKYVAEVREEFADDRPAPTPNTAKGPTNAYPLRKGWEWQEGDPNARSSAMLKKEGSIDGFTDEVDACNNMADLKWVENKWITHARKSGWTDAWKHTACNRIETREAEIIGSMSPEHLADVPLADALKHSLSQHTQ